MFVSKKTLTHLQASYDERLELVTSGYEARITQLESHLKDLRSLVFTPTSLAPTPEMLEVDQVLTPVNDAPIYNASKEADDILRERDRLFSGHYDEAVE